MIEPTVTQNNALYFAQHKIPRERIPLGRRFMQGLRRRRQKESPNGRAVRSSFGRRFIAKRRTHIDGFSGRSPHRRFNFHRRRLERNHALAVLLQHDNARAIS